MSSGFSINKFLKSFYHAFSGLKTMLISEQNFKIHIIAAIAAICLSFFFHVSRLEFLIILLCIGLVLSLEILNSAIEKLCDFVQPEKHSSIKMVKDTSASAVLVAAIISFAIGISIFLPKIISLFS